MQMKQLGLKQLETMKIKALLQHASDILNDAGVQSPEVDAELLFCHMQGISRGELGTAKIMGHDIDAATECQYLELVRRRTTEPLQHITGVAPFRYRELRVGPGVFIPRPETEMLIDIASQQIFSGAKVVDLCAGSGAIAAAVASENPRTDVYAVEISDEAIAYLQQNVQNLNVEVVHGDFKSELAQLHNVVDVVISNPPYVASTTGMSDEVLYHDPSLALYGGGEAGLNIPLQVIDRAHFLLKSGGFFVMEHDETQHRALKEYMQQQGWENIMLHHDLTGRQRATSAFKSSLVP
ncbi:MAG: peptide chain release factor N(5)-glutamine methyltransferase [Micrococcaceae bacterium]